MICLDIAKNYHLCEPTLPQQADGLGFRGACQISTLQSLGERCW